MLIIFFIFGFIFFIKSTILSYFYSNYLMFLLYPLEIAGLSLLNTINSLPNKKLLNYNNYLQWIIINWIGTENDYTILNEIDNKNTNTYVIILSWLFSFILYNLSYLFVNKFIKKNKINKIN